MPDVAFINLRYDSGALVHLELSWLSPVKLRRTVIVGSEKMLVYDDVSNEPIRIFDAGAQLPPPETFGEFRLSYRTGDIISPKVDPVEPLALEIADFCAAILDGTATHSTPQIGLDVIKMIEDVEDFLGRPVEPSELAVLPTLDAALSKRLTIPEGGPSSPLDAPASAAQEPEL
jgi:predicted dehydrogenase